MTTRRTIALGLTVISTTPSFPTAYVNSPLVVFLVCMRSICCITSVFVMCIFPDQPREVERFFFFNENAVRCPSTSST